MTNKGIALALVLSVGAVRMVIADNAGNACSILSDTVYRQLSRDDTPGRRVASVPVPGAQALECRDTARAVSAGFSKAMLQRHRYVIWLTPMRQRGELCLSQDLSQCYPKQDPLVPFNEQPDATFILRQWQAVRLSVTASMPAGTPSDLSRFDPVAVGHQLKRRLGQAANHRR